MNKTVLLILTALIMFLCPSCTKQEERIIDSSRAGSFEKDMPMDKALRTAQEKYTVAKSSLFLEGNSYPVYDLMYDNQLVMKLEPSYPDAAVLWRIWLYSDLYKTTAGIGVGSTVAEVGQHYTLDVVRTEGAHTCLFVQEVNMCFVIDPGDIPQQDLKNLLTPEKLPGKAKISLIIL